jgi:hypothetical protein
LKRSPEAKRLEEVLRCSRIVAGGFLGTDTRILEEIIESDGAELIRLGTTIQSISARMREITEKGKAGLGTPVKIDEKREVVVDENRGQTICPWPHAGGYQKTITTVRRLDTGATVRWSELSLHFVEAHGFFQGRGSPFRLEPRALVEVLFG